MKQICFNKVRIYDFVMPVLVILEIYMAPRHTP